MAKVMIVDDMASMRKMVAFTLESAGHEVTQADDGDVALDIAVKGSTFDLVITDVNMPNMDGITLTAELRKLAGFKFTPILLLTTESGKDKKMAGKAAGATGWLVKPFDPDKLLSTIKRVLG
ncbi:MAG: response regulator [Mariprofundaceae bacterium]